MNLYEYQAKALLKTYGLNLPQGELIFEIDDLKKIKLLNANEKNVVKAQVLAGGRGKGGGIKVTTDEAALNKAVTSLLGKRLITPQTTEKGEKIKCLYLEEGVDIESEYYLSMTLDAEKGKIALVVSPEGGMDIEAVAQNNPQSIFHLSLDENIEIKPYHIHYLMSALKLPPDAEMSFTQTLRGIFDAFLDNDAEMIEINPLVLTKDHEVMALDAKIALDDNAAFRHPEWLSYQENEEKTEKEKMAGQYDLAYVALEGNIGCLVNGAGLAMATVDAIESEGGKAANFLDVGGSASQEKVEKSLEILLSDEQVEGVFINIFGGIMKCDTIAQAVVSAAEKLEIKVPMVVRLEGNRKKEGQMILEKSALSIFSAESLDEGAERIVNQVEKKGDLS